MKLKFLLLVITALFCLNNADAQTHKIGQANYNCKLNKKGWFFNSEKLSCPACEATEKKEQTAKAAEDKRRNDAVKAKADKSASENLKLSKEEQQGKKGKETAKTASNTNPAIQNRPNAANGAINSNVKGQVPKVDPSAISAFSDRSNRVYGLISNEKQIVKFPYEDDYTQINRIKGTNLFEVMVMGKHPNGWEKYLYSFIIDHKGKRLSIDNVNKFDYPIEINTETNILYLYKKLAEAESIGNKCRESKTFYTIFESKEAAVADISKAPKTNCVTTKMASGNVTVYRADYNLKLLEKVDGYVIFDHWKSGLYRD